MQFIQRLRQRWAGPATEVRRVRSASAMLMRHVGLSGRLECMVTRNAFGHFGYLVLIETPSNPVPSKPQPAKAPIHQIAQEVLSGVWGVGRDRVRRLQEAGYDAAAVQNLVNQLVAGGLNSMESVTAVAREVIQGRWGNGLDRRIRLQNANFNPDVIQNRVNELLRG